MSDHRFAAITFARTLVRMACLSC